MRAAWLLLPSLATSLASSTACLRQTEFRCSTNEQCTPNGTCQTSVGYCSFPDSACGQRFGDSAGQYAGQCVDGTQPGAEAGMVIDAPGTVDSPPAATCPASFTPLPGAPAGGHVYFKLATNANWPNQVAACTALSTKAYLAVPNDAAELTGIAMVSGAAIFWVGIDDQTTEGQYVQATGGAATFLPWATGQPDGGSMENCVAATSTTFSDEKCTGGTSSRPGVCECTPP